MSIFFLFQWKFIFMIKIATIVIVKYANCMRFRAQQKKTNFHWYFVSLYWCNLPPLHEYKEFNDYHFIRGLNGQQVLTMLFLNNVDLFNLELMLLIISYFMLSLVSSYMNVEIESLTSNIIDSSRLVRLLILLIR